MSYFPQKPQAGSNLVGIGFVVLLHLIIGYALVSGLARKVVDVIRKPVEVSIIEEAKIVPPKAPPPPPKAPPPKAQPFAPPPEVQVAVQAPAPIVATPTPAPVAPAEPVRSEPRTAAVGITCPNHAAVLAGVPYPEQALRLGLSGEVVVDFIVTASGAITDINVRKSSNRAFNAAATAAVAQKLRCNGQGQDVRVVLPFNFRLDN